MIQRVASLILACQHLRAITHTALDLTNQTITIPVTEANKGHLYGIYQNGHEEQKIRIFFGPHGKPDQNLAQLGAIPSYEISKSGLHLAVFVKEPRTEDSVQWSGPSLPVKDQTPQNKKILEQLLINHGLEVAFVEPRSPGDLVKADNNETQKITSSNQPNQTQMMGIAAYEGRNPMELLTASTGRCQGRTDYALMVFLRVVAEQLNCEVCDLINEVMWDAVHTGRVWRCQKDNGMP